MYVPFPILEIRRPEIPSALKTLSSDLASVAEIAIGEIADDAIHLYQQEIVREGSVDKGHFLNTVKIQRQAWHQRDIGSDALYAGVIRRKGTTQIIGPELAGRAIARLGPSVESAFARQLMR